MKYVPFKFEIPRQIKFLTSKPSITSVRIDVTNYALQYRLDYVHFSCEIQNDKCTITQSFSFFCFSLTFFFLFQFLSYVHCLSATFFNHLPKKKRRKIQKEKEEEEEEIITVLFTHLHIVKFLINQIEYNKGVKRAEKINKMIQKIRKDNAHLKLD